MSRPALLVIDDNDAKRYAMSRHLEQAGYDVSQQANGADGMADTGTYSAVVLDVHLPDFSGFEVCRQLKKAVPGRPVVQISSVFVETAYRAAGNLSGADAYLVHPEPDELLATVAAVLRARPASVARAL